MASVIDWTDPAGDTTTFDEASGFRVLPGRKGFLSPSWSQSELDVAGEMGPQLQSILLKSRPISMQILLMGSTHAELLTKIDSLIRAMDPSRGDSVLGIERSDGLKLDLAVRLEGKLDFQNDEDWLGNPRAVFQILLRAQSPFYVNRTLYTKTFVEEEGGGWFPFPDLILWGADIFASDTVTNPGNAKFSWPTWYINGPGTGITLYNLTTSKSFSFGTYTLGAGEQIVIDTTPGIKSVKLGLTNLYSELEDYPSLFPLLSGDNNIAITMSSVSDDTSVDLEYYPLYLNAE